MTRRCVPLGLLLLFLSGPAARAQATVEMFLEGTNNDVCFSFDSPAFIDPLESGGDDDFSKENIFFETAGGRTYLRGNPSTQAQDSGQFVAEWALPGRKVSVRITLFKNDFHVLLSASPGGDILKWGFNLRSTADEFVTGLYERVVDGDQGLSWAPGVREGMDLRGQTVRMLIQPTLSLYSPFYISSKGYALAVAGTWPGYYDICKEVPDLIQIQFEGSSLDFTIATSDDPADLVKAHALASGPPILPPRWAFLPLRWRDENQNLKTYYDGTPVAAPYNSTLVEDVLMMSALDIPCGAMWIDRPWAKGYAGYEDFSWNEQQFPQPRQMIGWLKSKDINLLLWVAPWVAGSMAAEARAKHYAIAMAGSRYMDSSNVALIDFTNPDAVAWWQDQGIAKMLKQGIKGFKLDRSEEDMPESRSEYAFDGRTTRETRNDYPVEYVRAVNEVCGKYLGSDFLLFPRAAYTGSTRYSAFWGGDIAGKPEGLRCAIIAQQRAAIMGYPVWGSDIGGYWGGSLTPELCARWLAFGCFSPLMEVGPTENHGFWDMKTEPRYDTTLLSTWRLYARLHAHLADYSYRCAQEAHAGGMPIVRPLFLVYPDQKNSWDDWSTYMYGPDILVSAVWEMGKSTREVYLPEGETWIDAWAPGHVYKGGEHVTIQTPPYKIPLFIRGGSGLQLGDLNALYRESIAKVKNAPDLKALEKANFQ